MPEQKYWNNESLDPLPLTDPREAQRILNIPYRSIW